MNDNLLSYRKAEKEDFSFIYRYSKECFNTFDYFKTYQIRRFIGNPNGTIITDVIEWNLIPVGWAVYFIKKNWIRLYAFCMIPECQGRGFGKIYLRKRLETLSEYREIRLEVRTNNFNAIRLYSDLGFQIKKTIKGYYYDFADAYRMVKVN